MFSIERDKLLDSYFNQELVNCLPGIFYLYEVEGDASYLRRWNKKHEIVSGRTKGEMLHTNLIEFIDYSSRDHINDSFKILFKNGYIDNLYANILSTTGKVTPYMFEAYCFQVKGALYFMGLGLDISDLISAKEQIKILEFQKLQKEKELFAVALQEQKKGELLRNIFLKLENIEKNVSNTSNAIALKSLRKEINTHFSFNDNWDVFKKLFGEIHYNFFHNLQEQHPDLTKGELQYCAYIKIKMHASEICNIMNISKEGLAKKRYRLKKKLVLSKGQKLDIYISSF